MSKRLSRRTLLSSVAAAVGGTAATRALPSLAQTPTDTTRTRGPGPRPLGRRSRFEQPQRDPSPTSSRTPLQDLHGTITPSDLHFERHHGGIPDVDPREYQLLVHGLVDRPTVFSLDDLKHFPATSRICFLECSGNLRRGREDLSPQLLCGLTSQTEWTGVRLATVLREVGVQPKASWLLAEGQDAAVMTRSIPITKAWDDALIVYAQNGEPLRPAHGYPARLLLPGWEGNSSVKWLRRIDVGDVPFMTREETSRYTDPLGDGTARQFSFVMDARSVITSPSYPQTLEPGWHEIRGIAWSGRGRIERVEVSVDGGNTWEDSELQTPVLPKAHVRFRHLWNWRGAETEIVSRATDETGYIQPTFDALVAARGPRTRYHQNPVTGWRIGTDGQVRLSLERLGGRNGPRA
jgi:sulfane dehydrogenase subunit SoxC